MSELACYAVNEKMSKGRKFSEKPHPYRADFERDRDRIIHCSAFRRLEGKTQVFTPGLDDYYRTRLTHTIEVAQIGRTIASRLQLNVSLTEAICLAHDLGHPPFGHAGEKALDDLMADFGGFEHNLQSLRIVDLLEHPYPAFFGLNLMYETRLGLAKHRSTYDKPIQGDFSDALNPTRFGELNCSLEGQIADIADRIAYNCHDLEDGMRAGLITERQLEKIQIVTEAQRRINVDAIDDRFIRSPMDSIRRTRTAKTIIDKLVSDCIEAGKKTIVKANVTTIDDVYNASENLIVLSADSEAELAELEKFLLENFYLHKEVLKTANQVKKWLGELFKMLCNKPDLMPGYFQQFVAQQGQQRTVCDYIAGMTDRFCLKMLAPLE